LARFRCAENGTGRLRITPHINPLGRTRIDVS
jgi:hypothetical protein